MIRVRGRGISEWMNKGDGMTKGEGMRKGERMNKGEGKKGEGMR